MTESPDFVRNQDFFRTFASNILLAVFLTQPLTQTGADSGNHQTAQDRIFPIVWAAFIWA